MRKYLARRLASLVPVLFGASLLIFLLTRLMPGDVVDVMVAAEPGMTPEQAATLRDLLGFGVPLHVQYLHWLGGILTGDLGHSLWTRRTVAEIVSAGMPITLELSGLSVLVSLAIAVPSGIFSAVRRNGLLDYVVRVVGLFGLAMPHFWFAILLLLLCSKVLGWLPPLFQVGFFDDPLGNLAQMLLPVLTLAWGLNAATSRMLRSTMLETLLNDYVLTARAKGLSERVVVVRHALRNALIPVVTIVGLQIGGLLGGSLVVEQIFGLPGLGWVLVNAIFQRDYPVVQAAVLMLTVTYLVVNLAVDLLYAYIDPRIRYA